MDVKEKVSNLKTGRLRYFQFALLAMCLILASIANAACLLGDLAVEFSEAPNWLLQSFVTLPTFGGIVANIIAGVMATKIGKRNICLLGTALCFIGGFGAMFVPTLMLKIGIRVIGGFGVGLVQPMSASLIVDCFDDNTAKKMMGFQSACVGLGGSLFAYTMAGIMVFDWHYAYCAYLYCAAIFVFMITGFPKFVNEIGREKKEAAMEDTAAKPKKKRLPGSTYVATVGQLCYSLGYSMIGVCLSLAAVEVGISTTAAAAMIGYCGIISMVGGVVFGWVEKAIPLKIIGPLSLIMGIVGLVMIGTTSNVGVWYVAETLNGLAFSWWMPYINFVAVDGTDASNSSMATSFAFVGYSLGGALCAYVLAFVGSAVGGLSNHQGFILAAVLTVISFVIMIVYSVVHKAKRAKQSAASA